MHKMFQIIVVGGISLTGYACGRAVVVEGSGSGSGTGGGAFGSAVDVATASAVVSSAGAGGFPVEGPAPSSTGVGGFPSISGAGGASGLGGMGGASNTAGGGTGGFPQEGPMILDAGPPPSDAGCFPQETALPCPLPEAGPGGEAGAAPDASFPMEAPPPPAVPRP